MSSGKRTFHQPPPMTVVSSMTSSVPSDPARAWRDLPAKLDAYRPTGGMAGSGPDHGTSGRHRQGSCKTATFRRSLFRPQWQVALPDHVQRDGRQRLLRVGNERGTTRVSGVSLATIWRDLRGFTGDGGTCGATRALQGRQSKGKRSHGNANADQT